MKVALDFDGVLCDTKNTWIKLFHENWPDKPIPRDIDFTQYNLCKVFNCTRQELETVFNAVRYGKHMKYTGCCDSNWYHSIKRLEQEGHEVFILSANPEGTDAAIKYWLAKYGMEHIPIRLVALPENKFEHDWDVIIDDAPHIASRMEEFPDRRHLLYNNPWNESVKESFNVIRVYNFRQVYLEATHGT